MGVGFDNDDGGKYCSKYASVVWFDSAVVVIYTMNDDVERCW
jgi:hypothetical protein